MALGAGREDVLRLVVEQGAKLALLGVVTGSVAAMISTRLLASLLFGVETTDPATYVFRNGSVIPRRSCSVLLPGA
jgi:putative ABC transport system permease protein